MNSKFDAYEIIGVIAPGSLFLFGLAILYSDFRSLFFENGFSVGDLGLFLTLSFVAGHLIQAIGNLFESLLWKVLGGMPTHWLIENPEKLISGTQAKRFQRAIESGFSCDLRELAPAEWVPIVREIYSEVKATGNTERIDSFNRTYGFMRGVTVSFGVLSVLTLLVMWPAWKTSVYLAVAAFVAGYRMVRFGVRYGRELVVEYLRLIKAGDS